MILCRPAVAGLYGAILGVLLFLPGAGAAPPREEDRPSPPEAGG
jgi:hypothetical protein